MSFYESNELFLRFFVAIRVGETSGSAVPFFTTVSQSSLEASFLVDATEFAETLGFFDFLVEAELVDTRLLVSDVCCLSETSCAFSTQ